MTPTTQPQGWEERACETLEKIFAVEGAKLTLGQIATTMALIAKEREMVAKAMIGKVADTQECCKCSDPVDTEGKCPYECHCHYQNFWREEQIRRAKDLGVNVE